MKNDKKLKKVLLASILVSILCMPITVYAGENQVSSINHGLQLHETNVIQPRYQYTNSVSIEFDFTGYNAFGRVIVEGKSLATKITGTVKLLKKDTSGTYKTIKTWSNIGGEGTDLFYEVNPTVSAKGTYRFSFSGRVYSGTKSETVSGYSDAVCE